MLILYLLVLTAIVKNSQLCYEEVREQRVIIKEHTFISTRMTHPLLEQKRFVLLVTFCYEMND